MSTGSRFTTAGWVSIAAAVVFVVAWIVAFIEGAVIVLEEHDWSVSIGVSDFVFLLFAAMSVYVFMSLKSYLYERYSHRRTGLLIWIIIAWHIVFFVGAFLMSVIGALDFLGLKEEIAVAIGIFWVVGVAVFGILDMALGILLLIDGRQFAGLMKAFAVASICLGLSEVSVILSFLSLGLTPLALLLLAFVFFSRPESLEFV